MSMLEEIYYTGLNCKECDLHKSRNKIVVGQGVFPSPILVIGEAPGANEEETGIPFCGRSGKLLTAMLEEIGLYRDKNIYITNTVLCRPPKNRNPKASEMKSCRKFLDMQIATHNPKIIICVGRVPISTVIGKEFMLAEHHGQLIRKDNHVFFPVYHPAALLRNPNLKPIAKEDFFKLKEYILKNHPEILL